MSAEQETHEGRAVTTMLHALEQARQGRIVDRKIVEGLVADLVLAAASRANRAGVRPAPRPKPEAEPAA